MAQPTANAAGTPAAPDSPAPSAWDALRYPVFRSLWLATVVSNVGTWMYNAASGWLMTSLSPSPLVVSLVQVANSLPLFLFALPAGALADMRDKRRLILALEILSTVFIALFALLVTLHAVGPALLLVFIFVLGVLAALETPAWQAIVPLLVPESALSSAIAVNSVGVNISRVLGPAITGGIMAGLGIAAPFWLDAFSNAGVIGVIFRWRPPPQAAARTLLAAIGAGAVGGAFALPRLHARLGSDGVVVLGEAGTAAALVLFGLAHQPWVAVVACLLAGTSWIAALAILNVSAQTVLPDWVRGRGLAVYVTVFFGTLTVGSALWGLAAEHLGLGPAHYLAAGGALIALWATRRWKLRSGLAVDLTPSMHWPPPVLAAGLDKEAGPVLVTVEYHVAPENREAFLAALVPLAPQRQRNGAYDWNVFQDTSQPERMIETFLSDSWLDHLREHGRVTRADRAVEEQAKRLAREPPRITHYIAVRSQPAGR